MSSVVILLLGTSLLFCSCLVIVSTSPVTSVVYLIGTFALLSVLLCTMGMTYVGLTYIIVYVGGVIVLFLFVIMMIDLNTLPLRRSSISAPISFVLLSGCSYLYQIQIRDTNSLDVLTLFQSLTHLCTVTGPHGVPAALSTYPDLTFSDQIQSIGYELYTHQAIWLLLLSVLLLLSMVGPIVLCHGSHKPLLAHVNIASSHLSMSLTFDAPTA